MTRRALAPLRAVKDALTTRIPVALVVLAMVTGAPMGITLGKAFAEYTAPPQPVAEADAPTTPTPLAPGDNAVGVSRTPTFEWTPSEDESQVAYALAYSLDPTFRANVYEIVVFGMEDPAYTVPPADQLPAGATVWWMVQAVDEWNNFSGWSPLRSFTTGAE